MSARDELLDHLTAEQHNGGGWRTPPREWNSSGATTRYFTGTDDELTTAKRRRDLAADYARVRDDIEASA